MAHRTYVRVFAIFDESGEVSPMSLQLRVPEQLKIIGYDTRDEEKTIASAYAFRRRFLPQEVAVDPDIKHLVDNVYPVGRRELLQGERFIRTLKAVAYSYADKS